MMRLLIRGLLAIAVTFPIVFPACAQPSESMAGYLKQFMAGYRELGIPEMEYGYREYFQSVPDSQALVRQEAFFKKEQQLLQALTPAKLSRQSRAEYLHARYAISFNLERISLENGWAAKRYIPEGGLSSLEDHGRWYAHFIKKFTSTDISPEEVYALGLSEVQKVKAEISKLQEQLGFADSISFYKHLADSSFYLRDKKEIVRTFGTIDSTVRKHLAAFTGMITIPTVYAMEWPDASPNTPPGIYMNREFNSYGKDVFQYNFYGGVYNKRAMEWLYMHEAIPGHHLQYSFHGSQQQDDSLMQLFLYPGNFEGWGCYVEYFGKELGLYQDPYEYLGKWEWDLVRSARLVIDAGIHYYGWSYDKALAYWKETIPGQDAIAAREVSRVTNWPGQALSYKVGADFIFKLKKDWLEAHPGKNAIDFHRAFLEQGRLPLTVIRKDLLNEEI